MKLTTIEEIAEECELLKTILASFDNVTYKDGILNFTKLGWPVEIDSITSEFLNENGFILTDGVYQRPIRTFSGYYDYREICLIDSGLTVPIDPAFMRNFGIQEKNHTLEYLVESKVEPFYYKWKSCLYNGKEDMLFDYDYGTLHLEGGVEQSPEDNIRDFLSDYEIIHNSRVQEFLDMKQAIQQLIELNLIKWSWEWNAFIVVGDLTPIHRKWLESKKLNAKWGDNVEILDTSVWLNCVIDDMNVIEMTPTNAYSEFGEYLDKIIGFVMTDHCFIACDGKTIVSRDEFHQVELKEWILYRFMIEWELENPVAEFGSEDGWVGTILEFKKKDNQSKIDTYIDDVLATGPDHPDYDKVKRRSEVC